MFKSTLFIALAFCLSGFAEEAVHFKVCGARSGQNDFYITSETFRWVAKIPGKKTEDSTYKIESQKTFTQADYTKEDMRIITAFTGLKSFTDGVSYNVKFNEQQSYAFMVFNYGKNQKAVMAVAQGWPLPVGRTEDCR